jgi:16S rRNA (guanine966-N2)-methyltransferase
MTVAALRGSIANATILPAGPAGALFPFSKASTVPAPSANRVRIIGGAMRGRMLRFPPLPGLRPTPDRVRETLFNWLGQDLTGKRCLDLYSGTGALALEAASRQAALSVAVEHSRPLAEALRATGATFGAPALEVHCADVRSYLAHETREFDVIFMDPPFAGNPWSWLLPAALMRLAQGGTMYAEAGERIVLPGSLAALRHDRAGQVHYHLLARAG